MESERSVVEAMDEVDDRYEDGGEVTRFPRGVVYEGGGVGDGGSYPMCCTPRSQMGSVHLSGVASLSSR